MIFTETFMDFGGTVYFYRDVDALPREKENAVMQFLSMICRSWTFCRMTEKEKEYWVKTVLHANRLDRIKGNYDARWLVLSNMYDAFLNALGYLEDQADWRGRRSEKV